MKTIILLFTVFFSFVAKAQVKKITLQASGLTCSMCSNSINKSLKTINFVDKVTSNIKTSSFEINIKPNTVVDFDKLKKKVEDAGFFVAKFTVNLNFINKEVANDEHFVMNNMAFHFLNIKNQVLNGERTIQFLDKGFVSSKAYKKNAGFTKMLCYKTGVAAACCPKSVTETPGKRIFHVTLV